VLALIRAGDTVSVAEIAAVSRFSKTTVKKTIDLLASLKLVVSAGKGVSTDEGGKKPELFRFNKDHGYVISLHVTPVAIVGATTDLRADITHYTRSEVTAERELPLILDRLAQIVRSFVAMKAKTAEKLIGIVVALPGLADPSRGISIFSPHYPTWGRDVPLTDMLRERLGPEYDVPTFIDCVNRYQAIAEREKGIARGATNFMILDAIDVGLGSGIVVHGELMRGNQSLAGEIGHMTVNPIDGPLCNCGNRGCFEAMVSTRRIRGMIRDARAQGVDSQLFRDGHPDEVGLDTVCHMASQGDGLCSSIIDDVARWFVVGLGNIIMVNDPELIVIQGQYVKAGSHFLSRLRDGLKGIGLPDVEKRARIEYSKLGEERGVLGGAAFVVQDYFARRLTF
jgi:predicted NBD/HSP70 family sugar kinase